LIHITGGGDLTLEEVAHVGELMAEQLPGTKRIIWGANVDETMTGRIRIMALFASVGKPVRMNSKRTSFSGKRPSDSTHFFKLLF